MDATSAWDVERKFWLEGPDFYRGALSSDCLMAFPPPAGLMRRDQILASLETAPRWTAVQMVDRVVAQPNDATIILGYRAEAQRANARPYQAICTSTYIHEATGWRLAQHQQSPV